MKVDEDPYDIYINDELVFEDKVAMSLCINNGKFIGGGLYMSPYSLVNDGLADLVLTHGYVPKKTRVGMLLDQSSGSHVYRPEFSVYRGKSFKVCNKKPLNE